jgi:hypothetical protein
MRARLDPAALPKPRTWHAFATRADAILATLAFPPTRADHARAEALAANLSRLRHTLPAGALHKGDNSGYDGTTVRHTFDLGIAEWLVARFPADVEIDWRDAAASDAVESLLRPAVLRAEEDGYDSDALSFREWVRAARGTAWTSDLSWVLDALRDTGDSLARRATTWDRASLPIVWKLRGAGVMHARLATSKVVARPSFRATPAQPRRTIAAPLRAITRLALADADRVIDVARETLAVRGREVHAISHANRDEVWLAELGAGTSIAIIGVLPELRLSLEANYGYVLFANGVPVGYGGVSPLFRQANTGINIFAPFRGTEAGMLWTRALQAFHALFGVKRFIANPYQIGGGNTEALQSGAFWFYHRIGFRPTAPELSALADAELAERTRNRAHRSPTAVLRKLAGADLVLTLPGFDARDAFDERWLARISLRDTAHIAEEGHLLRHVAVERIATRVARALGAQRSAWTRSERAAFASLAPVVDLVPDLSRWPATQRRNVIALLRAKGHPQERDFVHAAAKAPRLFHALAELAQGPLR